MGKGFYIYKYLYIFYIVLNSGNDFDDAAIVLRWYAFRIFEILSRNPLGTTCVDTLPSYNDDNA